MGLEAQIEDDSTLTDGRSYFTHVPAEFMNYLSEARTGNPTNFEIAKDMATELKLTHFLYEALEMREYNYFLKEIGRFIDDKQVDMDKMRKFAKRRPMYQSILDNARRIGIEEFDKTNQQETLICDDYLNAIYNKIIPELEKGPSDFVAIVRKGIKLAGKDDDAYLDIVVALNKGLYGKCELDYTDQHDRYRLAN